MAPKSCSPKLLPKDAGLQSCRAKLLFPTAAPQNLLHKAVPQSRSRKLSKAAPNSCSPKLLKLPPKVVSESCFPKFFSKATPQRCRFSKQLFVNAAAKTQSCSPQLFPKAALQSCYRKPQPKKAPQNSKAAPRSCLKAGPESCAPKLFSKAVANLFDKAAPQSYSPKRLPKAAAKSCYRKLLPKAAIQSCSSEAAILQTYAPKQVPKAILQSGSRKLLPTVATEMLLPEVVCKAAPESCSPKPLFFKSIVP